MNNQPSGAGFHGIAQVLIMEQLIDEKTAQEALIEAEKNDDFFINYLVSNELACADAIAQAGARNFGVPLLDLGKFDKSNIPYDLIDAQIIERHHVVPLYARGDSIFVAMDDPCRHQALNEIKFQTGLTVQAVVVEAVKFQRFIEDVLSAKESASLNEFLDDSHLDNIDITSGEDEAFEDSGDADDAPVVRFVHKVILDAVNKGASDIHFEPYERSYRVRFRQDGILYEIASPPLSLANRISARLKVMSNLDISERRIPQDGRFKMRLSANNSIDFRVSTCPTVSGEKVVMRILDPTAASLGVELLGFSKAQEEAFMKIIHEPQGMVLVTGPTGSGKTVTLYTALNILNTAEKNISTAEDPVEIKLSGVNQVNINPKTGLTFSSVLRSFLRQDPDIIMVGEMRDLETAEIGVKAALTGHLVLSTLHTNSAPETLTRLANMGVPLFNIASSVSLIIAQRLARRLCSECKQQSDINPDTLKQLGFTEQDMQEMTLYHPVGCDICTSGYKGRVGLYEVLVITEKIKEIILAGGTATDIREVAIQEGMITMRMSGKEKVKQGITTMEEVSRVTKD